jgi:hypothetical protein
VVALTASESCAIDCSTSNASLVPRFERYTAIDIG